MPAAAALADLVVVLLFAAIGRASHDEGFSVAASLEVAAPFLIALAAGWVVARAWRRPAGPVTGVVVWAVTLAGGMLLRGAVFGRDVEPSFVVVAGVFLAAGMLGWRAVLLLARRGRAHGTAG